MFNRRYAILLLLLLLLLGLLAWVVTLQAQMNRSASRTSFGVCPPDPSQCINGNTWTCTNYKLLFVCNNGIWDFWTGLDGSSGATGATGATGPSISTDSTSTTSSTTSTSSTSSTTSTSTTSSTSSTTSTSSTSSTSSATTTTVPTTTTTTGGGTTSPSAFSITCPPDFVGEIEDTVAPTNYSIVGTGCGNSTITVYFNDTTVLTKKENSRVNSNGQTLRTVPIFVSGSSTNVTTDLQPVIYTNVTLLPDNTTEVSQKRYVNLTYSAFVGQSVYSPQLSSGTLLTDSEYLISAAGGKTLQLVVSNSQVKFALALQDWGPGFIGLNITAIDLTSIFNSNCYPSGNQYYQSKVVFDYEAQRLVMFMMYNGYLCAQVSSTNSPFSNWTGYVFNDTTNFVFTHGFDAEVWGNYYNLCWNNATASRSCVILERSAMLLSNPAQYILMQNFITPVVGGFGLSPIDPVGQRSSTRGTLINVTAPCGVYAALDEGASVMRFAYCSNIVFGSPTPVFITILSVPINGGWSSGINLPCQTSGGCIIITPGNNVISLSNYLRMSYYNYASYEQFAYAFTTGIDGSTWGGTSVLWGHMNTTTVAAETSVTPDTVTETGAFAADISLTCRKSTVMSYSVATPSSGGAFTHATFQLSTDSPNLIRFPSHQITPSAMAVTGSHNWGIANLITGPMSVPRGFLVSIFTDLTRTTYGMWIQNQTTSRVWTAQDVCGATSECTQALSLGTLTACENTIET